MMSLKLRTRQISIGQHAAALAAWPRSRATTFHTPAVSGEHFARAASFANQHELDVRVSDALHFAIAAKSGFHPFTLDMTMARAAPLLGVPVDMLD